MSKEYAEERIREALKETGGNATLARQLVESFALVLERRVHRRNLLNLAPKTLQRPFDIGSGDIRDRASLDDLALGIAGGGGFAQLDAHPVTLVRVEQKGGDLGGRTEADRQQTAGQRIEAAGVACLPGEEDPLDPLQRGVRGLSHGFVEQQDTLHIAS